MLLFGFAVEVVEELPVLSVRVNVVLGRKEDMDLWLARKLSRGQHITSLACFRKTYLV